MRVELASDNVINAAYAWLCDQRRHWPADCDVWDLRLRWCREKQRIQAAIQKGDYRFSPMSRVTKSDGEAIHVWSSQDALVLKALAIVLAKYLPLSRLCTHVRGHGGAKAAVRTVRDQLPHHAFVMRTDVKGYYDNIDQHRMLARLAVHVKDRSVLNLLWQVMRRTVTWGGLYRDRERGISRGCPLSPLLGAFFLRELDRAMEKLGLCYVRFMDDIVVLAPTRWKLRRAVSMVNRHLAGLGLTKHPDKTFIGRIEKGFDFLGYRFSRAGLTVASATVDRFIERIARLYEQEQFSAERPPLLGPYVRRWVGWARGGLKVKQMIRLRVSIAGQPPGDRPRSRPQRTLPMSIPPHRVPAYAASSA